MKLTKYEHACVVLENQGKKLVIDPGEFTPTFGELDNVVAIVVTHVHGDHFNTEHLQEIFGKSPEAKLFTTTEVSQQVRVGVSIVAKVGEPVTIGPFKLEFFGELHNQILNDVPANQNIGVLVNDSFYYGGDSYTTPNKR